MDRVVGRGISREDVHPDLTGEATTAEMLRSFWPFTVGHRRRLGVSFAFSLVQFAIAAALPMLTGDLLSAALRSTTASAAVERYSDEWLARANDTAALIGDLAPSSADPVGTTGAIRAAQALQSVASARGVVDELFPGDLVYDTSGSIGRDLRRQIGESDEVWVQVALAVTDDDRIGRPELDVLEASDEIADQRAFDFLVGVLALDRSADSQRHGEQTRLLITSIAQFVAAIAALAAVRFVALVLSQRTLLSSGRALQDSVFNRIHDSMLLESGEIPRPSMVSRCSAYVETVVKALRGMVVSGIPAVMNLVLSVALLVWIDVTIGLIMLSTVILFEVARRIVTPSWSRTVREQIDRTTAVGEVVDEAVTSERSTRLQRAEQIERRRFVDKADLVRSALARLGNYAASFDVSAGVVGQFGVVAITAIVGIGRRDLSVGEATAAVLYAQAVAGAVAAIPPTVIGLQEAAPYMRRLQRVLLSPVRWYEPSTPVSPPAVVDGIAADALETVDLDGRPILCGLSFAARHGSVTVVVGTDADEGDHLVRLLGGLERPVHGAVLVGGVGLADLAFSDARRLVHVVPRFVTVFAASFEDNVTLGEPTRSPVADVVGRAGLDDFTAGLISRMSSDTSSDRRRVSSEALARLGLARAVSSVAEVIVIEDPSPALDREAAHRWWSQVRTALADRIVVVVTDQVDVLHDDDAVVVVRSGAVAETGSRHTLLESGRWFPEIWRRSSSSAIETQDLASLPMLVGLDQGALEAIAGRMVTERYDTDEPIFVAGDPADRVFVVLDGRVELSDSGRRVGTVGPGGHFGDFTVSHGRAVHDAVRTTTARARGPVVVRSLHRLAVSSGVLGALERTPTEQRLYAHVLRRGEASLDELRAMAPDTDVDVVLASLLAAGLVVAADTPDTYRSASFTRRPRLSADWLIT